MKAQWQIGQNSLLQERFCEEAMGKVCERSEDMDKEIELKDVETLFSQSKKRNSNDKNIADMD